MKVLICGGTGYIGAKLGHEARMRFDEVLLTSSDGRNGTLALDLSHTERFDFGCLDQGDTVLLTAAISAPDVCAKEPERARAANVTGSARLVEASLRRGARVAFFSSDTVYGQQAEAFDESQPCKPAGLYAEMKREVERQFEGDADFKSLRLSYVFSLEDKFTRYLAHCAAHDECARIFDPFVRAVIHRDDVVEAALSLVQSWTRFPQRVFNFGGPQALSRVQCVEILRAVAWPSLKFEVATPDDAFFVNRPRQIQMSSPGLSLLLGRSAQTLAAAAALEFGGYQEKQNG